MMQIAISKPMVPTRPCRFCLCLQGGSVFADFDVDSVGRVYAVRVSFDGYGCCTTSASSKMNPHDSAMLLSMIDRAERALRSYFKTNCDVIWNEALEHHDLI